MMMTALQWMCVPVCWFSIVCALRKLFGFRLIGLTGGIASGKSTAARYLWQQHGALIIDFDQLSRVVVQPGRPALRGLVAAFGNDILNSDGTLNREKLGARCFGDRAQLRKLNAIMRWPMAREILSQTLRGFVVKRRRVVIWDAPLLFEQSLHKICDSTLMIYVSHDVEVKRLCSRDNITDVKEAEKKIASQWPLDRKRKLATTVITNEGSMDELQHAITSWWCALQRITTVTPTQGESRDESLAHIITHPTRLAATLATPIACVVCMFAWVVSTRA